MQNKNKTLKSYSEEQDIKNIKKMREILASLPPFCRQYFRGIETTTSARTRLGYAYDLRIFFEFLHENNPSLHAVPVTSYKISLLNDICKDDIEEYMEYLSYYEKDGRVYTNDERGKARKLSALRSMFRYFYQSELIEKDVTSLVPVPKRHEKAIIRLDAEEVSELLDLAEDGQGLTKAQLRFHNKTKVRDTALLTLLLGTGIRVSECVGLDLQDINFKDGALKVHRKGGYESIVYFGREVAGALQDYDRATIVGTRTYGKGLVQSIRPLPYDGQLKVTTAKYYTPSGRCVQAIDYSHRNEDGSVGHIPDSLTHEFTTAHGRKVRDGGGIKPDFEVKGRKYSRLTYSLVLSGIVEQYALKFVREHETIPPVDQFHFTDYDDFVSFASDKEFDYRSTARAQFDEMRKTLVEDGLEDAMKDRLDAMEKALDMDKESFLRLKKEEILPFIEEEIAVRYYFQKAGIRVRLRYDDALRESLRQPSISYTSH